MRKKDKKYKKKKCEKYHEEKGKEKHEQYHEKKHEKCHRKQGPVHRKKMQVKYSTRKFQNVEICGAQVSEERNIV